MVCDQRTQVVYGFAAQPRAVTFLTPVWLLMDLHDRNYFCSVTDLGKNTEMLLHIPCAELICTRVHILCIHVRAIFLYMDALV